MAGGSDLNFSFLGPKQTAFDPLYSDFVAEATLWVPLLKQTTL